MTFALHVAYGNDVLAPLIVALVLGALAWLAHAARRIRKGVAFVAELMQNGIRKDISDIKRMVEEHDVALRRAGILKDRRRPRLNWDDEDDD